MLKKSLNAIKETTKKQKENFKKETPKKWRQIGNLILSLGGIASGYFAGSDNPKTAAIALSVAYILKTITNFKS